MASDIFPQKTCSSCGHSLPVEKFGLSAAYRDGRRGQCTPCRVKHHAAYMVGRPKPKPTKEHSRRSKLKQRYGMTDESFSTLLETQGGGCAICGTSKPGGRWDTFHVGHCHETGAVRGILCHACNVNLGRMGDSLDSVMRYIEYLKRKHHEGCTI